MRKQIYLKLIEKLKELKDSSGNNVILAFDLWNEQVDFIEEEEPFPLPAVFIEFQPIRWNGAGIHIQQAEASIRLHIVTSWKGSERDGATSQDLALMRFDLLDDITAVLGEFIFSENGNTMTAFRRTGSATNHNHGELIEDVESYSCRLIQSI